MSDFFGNGQGEGQINYKPSSYKFTDPIRYFKANDPYYWEVDNIPLKQIQENVLWLKDQVSAQGVAELGDVGRSNFTELRPESTGEDRVVTVRPGRFMGRVNDAYNTGIATINKMAQAFIGTAGGGFISSAEKESVTLSDEVLKVLVGDVTSQMLGNNGLYDHLQTHLRNTFASNTSLSWGSIYTYDSRNQETNINSIYNMPKIKLAMWSQDTTTSDNYEEGQPTDLQQRAVEWTRAWGAPFRTSLVDVEKPLSIEIPEFSDSDYKNETQTVPSVRVDLLFIYTKPVDAKSTAIAKPAGTSPAIITQPQLGLVRGAGVVALTGRGGWEGETIDGDFLESAKFLDNRDNKNHDYWFEAENSIDSKGNSQITSPISDLTQEDIGASGVFGNFPSPDDLMNLAPLIAADPAIANSPHLVGQSVLPIAYIFVNKEDSVITSNNILDIRPFFRTAELAYNERAGLAAADPPASIANPVVTDRQMANTVNKVSKYLNDKINGISFETPESPVIGAGTIFGGLLWGTENVIMRMAEAPDDGGQTASIIDSAYGFNNDSTYEANKGAIAKYFHEELGYTDSPVDIPLYPDWDLADWVQTTGLGTDWNDVAPPGQVPTDYIQYAYYANTTDGGKSPQGHKFGANSVTNWFRDSKFNGGSALNKLTAPVQYLKPNISNCGASQLSWKQEPEHSSVSFLRKKIIIDRSNVSWMTDYDVEAHFVNSVGEGRGISIEKYKDHFIISVSIPSGETKFNPQVARYKLGNQNCVYPGGDNEWERSPLWAAGLPTFWVSHAIQPGVADKGWTGDYDNGRNQLDPKLSNILIPVVYPTIKFSVIGHRSGVRNESLGGNNPTLVLG